MKRRAFWPAKMPTNYHARNPRGQQRDKLYREALRIELAAAGEDLKELREIAKAHIAKCKEGDMQAIKELADRLDGKPTQMLEHAVPEEGERLTLVRPIVHVTETREQIERENDQPLMIEHEANGSNGHGNGSGN
jgi:hypothetical protein